VHIQHGGLPTQIHGEGEDESISLKEDKNTKTVTASVRRTKDYRGGMCDLPGELQA
jgi:hypothetical protein